MTPAEAIAFVESVQYKPHSKIQASINYYWGNAINLSVTLMVEDVRNAVENRAWWQVHWDQLRRLPYPEKTGFRPVIPVESSMLVDLKRGPEYLKHAIIDLIMRIERHETYEWLEFDGVKHQRMHEEKSDT